MKYLEDINFSTSDDEEEGMEDKVKPTGKSECFGAVNSVNQ